MFYTGAISVTALVKGCSRCINGRLLNYQPSPAVSATLDQVLGNGRHVISHYIYTQKNRRAEGRGDVDSQKNGPVFTGSS